MHPTVSDALLDVIDNLAAKQLPGRRETRQALAASVRAVSDAYTRRADGLHELPTTPESLDARLRFFLPRDLPKLWGPLSELDRVGAMPQAQSLRVLDVGCGLGTTSLGAALYFGATDDARPLDITAVDRDRRTLELMEALFHASKPLLGAPVAVQTQRLDASAGDFADRVGRGGGYDLILAGLVLNELTEGAPSPTVSLERGRNFLRTLAGLLSPDGAIVVLEPALKAQSRLLQQLRSENLETPSPVRVFAPCTHDGPCPLLLRKRDWCHDRRPLSLPARLRAVAADAGLREQGLSYSYLTLTTRDRSLAEIAGGERALRAVSGPLHSKGKVELDLCGPAGGLRLMQLRRKPIAADEDLAQLGRGTVVSLPGSEGGAKQPDGAHRGGGDRNAHTQGPPGRHRLSDGELRVHQAWSAPASVVDPLRERTK